jgi:hypothetical protein
MAKLPEGWQTLPSGAPAPNWVATVTEARERRLATDGSCSPLVLSDSSNHGATLCPMTAKEKLLRDVLDLDEAKAARARIVVTDEPAPESETVPLPEGWNRMANGEPMPDVAAAVRRSREGH